MSAETAVLTIDLLFCIAAAMALASIKWAQPATVVSRDSRSALDSAWPAVEANAASVSGPLKGTTNEHEHNGAA